MPKENCTEQVSFRRSPLSPAFLCACRIWMVTDESRNLYLYNHQYSIPFFYCQWGCLFWCSVLLISTAALLICTRIFLLYLTSIADFFCIQESKLQEGQIELDLPGYHQYWNYAEKKGYSGTAIFAKKEPLAVTYGLGIPEHDKEGRVITLEYETFYLVTCYTPNSQNELVRLPYRMDWEDAFLLHLKALD